MPNVSNALRFLVIGDPHACDRPPLGRHEGYREQILTKLAECAEIANKEKVNCTIITGDIFHQPRSNLVSHRLVRELQEVFGRFANVPLTVVGNHDQGEEGMDSLYRQPLGVLDGAVQIIREPEAVVEHLLVARHYDAQRDLDPTYYRLDREEDPEYFEKKWAIMVAHGSILPANRETPFPYVPLQKIDLTGIALLINGHVHDGYGLHKLGDTYYLNPGSLGRVSRKDLKAGRMPSVWLISWDGKDFSFSEIALTSALPPEEVFIEQSTEGEADNDEIRAFVERVEKGLALEEASLDEMLNDVPKNIRPLVKHYISEAGGI